MGRVQGKVAFITGAARGQGRSHAIRLAEEGADIIAVDICKDFETVGYPMATPDDLKETARLVEKLDRRIVTAEADVRDRSQLTAALERGISELGKVDVVVAQAGIAAMKGQPPMQAWTDSVDTLLLGTINAIQAALPHLSEGASVIATGSVAAYMNALPMMQLGTDPGGHGYMYAKRAIATYIHELARNLAPRMIRANAIHPTNATRTCCRASRCTSRSGRTWSTPPRTTPPRRSTSCRRMPLPCDRAGRHQQHGAVPGLGRVPLRHRACRCGSMRAAT